MKIDYVYEIIAWVVTLILLICFISRSRIREAILVFFFTQLVTLLLGLAVVQLGYIVYPVRFFPKATGTSFSFEYFIYPSICAIFVLHYPVEKSKLYQFLYYSFFCSVITVIEVLVERYTDIIEYVHWTWYITWITLFITFFMSRQFYQWFYRLGKNNKIEKV